MMPPPSANTQFVHNIYQLLGCTKKQPLKEQYIGSVCVHVHLCTCAPVSTSVCVDGDHSVCAREGAAWESHTLAYKYAHIR